MNPVVSVLIGGAGAFVGMFIAEVITGGSNWMSSAALRFAARLMRNSDPLARDERIEEWRAELAQIRAEAGPILAAIRALTFAVGTIFAAQSFIAMHPAPLADTDDMFFDPGVFALASAENFASPKQKRVHYGEDSITIPDEASVGSVLTGRSGQRYRLVRQWSSTGCPGGGPIVEPLA